MITPHQLAETVVRINKVSCTIDQDRDYSEVALALVSEVGELAEEIRIEKYPFHKQAGKDGIIGELADVVICVTDFVYSISEVPVLDMENMDPSDTALFDWEFQIRDIHSRDHDIDLGEAFAIISTCAGLSPATRFHTYDQLILIDHVSEIVGGVLNGAIQVARIADLDYNEFSKVVDAKLEKWQNNYSK